ncbi:MAG: hypothetical protein JNL26_10950 [Gemmatimonadetes bacterium]|nr:hypothetical protein [Gemmatimonadota bacterium]
MEPTPEGQDADVALGRRVGVGCFSLFVGTWSGAMVAVLLGKVIEGARRSPSCEGLPTCNWYVYAGVGALVGAVSLPALVFWRLRRGSAPSSNGRG